MTYRLDTARFNQLAATLWLSAASVGVGVVSAEDITKDELLFVEVPMVVSSARREQRADESPFAVFVLTAEDIRASGATTIPDALRLVPGVDVMTVSARNQAVAVRGMFHDAYNSKVLVMVDGRSVYWDVYGTVLWEMLPVTLDEIERIEVLRGPSSSLYGSNAYSAVISIVTRSPESIDGLQFSLSGGEYNTIAGQALFGRRYEKVSVKASAEANQTDEWSRPEGAGMVWRGNAQARYAFSNRGSVAIAAGRAHVDEALFFADETVGSLILSGDADYAQFEATYDQLRIRALYKKEDFEAMWLRNGDSHDWVYTLFDADLQHSFTLWGGRNSVVWGGGYRTNAVSPNVYIPREHQQNLFGLFVDDELRVGSMLRLGAGIRYDWHPLTGSHFSPRGSALFSPVREHQVRLNVGTAFRNPTFLDSYLDFDAGTGTIPGLGTWVYHVNGSTKLEAENLLAVELAHHGLWFRRVATNLQVYYRRYTRLYNSEYDTTFSGDMLTFTRNLDDQGDAHGLGGECDVSVPVTKWLDAFGSYSYQRLFTMNSTGPDPAGDTLREYNSTPHNKCNVGLRVRLGGLRVGGYLHWSQGTRWVITDAIGNDNLLELPSRVLVNGRISYEVGNVEASIAAFNLFDRKYYEHPVGEGLPEPISYQLSQKVTVQLTCRF